MDKIRIFACYSSKDKVFAGRLKYLFESCTGFEVFLAHDDLNYSEDFIKGIRKALQRSDILLALISKNFLVSSFANQEVGISLGVGRRIIPVSIDGTYPDGFLKNVHTCSCRDRSDDDEILKVINEIFSLFIQHPKFKSYLQRVLDCLVNSLKDSDSWKTTSRIISMILLTDKIAFSKEQIEVIIDAIKSNHEVYKAGWVLPKLLLFLKNKYNVEVDVPSKI